MNTEQWAPLLKPFWDQGMTSWKESHLIHEAVLASNGQLTVERVKMWISNYRKKVTRSQRDVRQKTTVLVTKTESQDFEVYENPPNNTYMTSNEEYNVITPTFGADSSPMNTDQWAPILKPFWDRGMTSWKESQLISEAVNATNGQLDTERVKTWIANYRKKVARPRKDFSPKAKKQRVTGYDVYCRTLIPLEIQNALEMQQAVAVEDPNGLGGAGSSVSNTVVLPKETFSNISLSWQSLAQEEKYRYEQQAESENHMNMVSPEISAERLRRKSMRIIQREMLKLQQLGCKGGMFLCVSPDSKKIMYSSDLEARSVFVAKESKEFRNMYLQTFKGAQDDDLSNQVALSKRSFLRRSVQRLFKRKYVECSGFCGAFPYNFFRRGLCYATGLPDGITIKTVGEYSVTQLQNILDCADNIQFHKTPTTGESANTIDKTTGLQADAFLSQNIDPTLFPLPQPNKPAAKAETPGTSPFAISKRSFLRRAVKSLFTQKYFECSGVESAFPYSFFREGVYYATGMPMDLQIKTVGEYSVTQLQAILDASGYIQFHKTEDAQVQSGGAVQQTPHASVQHVVQHEVQHNVPHDMQHDSVHHSTVPHTSVQDVTVQHLSMPQGMSLVHTTASDDATGLDPNESTLDKTDITHDAYITHGLDTTALFPLTSTRLTDPVLTSQSLPTSQPV